LKEKLKFYKNSKCRFYRTNTLQPFDLFPITLCDSGKYLLFALILNPKDIESPVIKISLKIVENEILNSEEDFYELIDYYYIGKKASKRKKRNIKSWTWKIDY